MSARKLAVYVDGYGDLVTMDSNETIRRATAAERRESREFGGASGAIAVMVSERTLRRRAPRLVRMIADRERR